MTSCPFGWSPSPASLDEADLRPEKIRFKVFCNPRSQLPGVQSASVGVLQVLDEGSAVLNESCVASDPDLEDTTLAELVCAPEDEAHAVAVAKKREETIVAAGVMVRSVGKEADAVAVVDDGMIGERDQAVEIRVGPRFDNFQGVRCRGGRSDRFLGHLVAAIFGKAVRE